MKKILLFVFITISFLLSNVTLSRAVDCKFDGDGDEPISGIIDNCIENNTNTLVKKQDGKSLVTGAGTNILIKNFIENMGILLSIGAVLMIVYSGFLMTLSGGEDEKIKKGKDLLKWTLIGYIALLSAGGIVSLLIFTIYDFAA